jgi:hypothetical protein
VESKYQRTAGTLSANRAGKNGKPKRLLMAPGSLIATNIKIEMAIKLAKFEPVKFITDSNAIEDIYGEAEIEQSLLAWNALDKSDKLSHYDICRTQKVITLNQADLKPNWRGYYRNVSGVNVQVGDRVAPSADKVEQLMEAWLNELFKMPPLIAHMRFESIHPFADGNGRTGRMIYWWHCNKLGLNPYWHTKKDVKQYYRLFEAERIERLEKINWLVDYPTTPNE